MDFLFKNHTIREKNWIDKPQYIKINFGYKLSSIRKQNKILYDFCFKFTE